MKNFKITIRVSLLTFWLRFTNLQSKCKFVNVNCEVRGVVRKCERKLTKGSLFV
ncbi:MAG: hypothetical protein ACTS4U_00025 [Candidatus Hodgkinia cicadicola]